MMEDHSHMEIQNTNMTLGMPLLATFTNRLTLLNRLSLYWSVEQPGTNDEMIHAVLTLKGSSNTSSTSYMHRSYFALGFGKSMIQSEMIVCHLLQPKSKGLYITERMGTGKYELPMMVKKPWAITPIQGIFANDTAYCEFMRKTRQNDGIHASWDISEPQPILFAYSLIPKLNFEGDYLSFHGLTNVGTLEVNWLKGTVSPHAQHRFANKQIHGILMSVSALVLIPTAVFTARYLRWTFYWRWIHIIFQPLALVLMLAAIGIMSPYVLHLNHAHGIMGILIFLFIGIQAMGGIFNYLGLKNPVYAPFKQKIRLIHRGFGLFILVMVFIQPGLGIDILYPYEYYYVRRTVWWPIYFSILGFWATLFLIAECYFQMTVFRHEKEKKLATDGHSVVDPNQLQPRKQSISNNESTSLKSLIEPNQFTWQSLSKLIQEGKMYVVANRKYVYDISPWINSHAGGRLILIQVNGTDITNDYFKEAGFDADDFVPFSASKSTIVHPTEYVDNLRLTCLSEEDWKFINQARMPHLHSRLAIERLSSLYVGELVYKLKDKEGNTTELVSGAEKVFDPYEYRRYAVTAIEKLNQDEKAIYKIRFCLLYPNDFLKDEPTEFGIGQYMEIDFTIKNQPVSRFYYPAAGTLVAFDIVIQLNPQGIMTPFLIHQRPGNRQFRIRGPFGAPWLHPKKPISDNDSVWMPKAICCISAGRGLFSFLQMLSLIFYPRNTVVEAIKHHASTAEGEMSADPGDSIQVIHHFNDGWAYGINLNNSQFGVFPLSIIRPPCGESFKLLLVHCVNSEAQLVERSFFEGLASSFPSMIDIHFFVSNSDFKVRKIPGTIHTKRLEPSDIISLMAPYQSIAMKRVYISTPAPMAQWLFECLQHEHVHILNDNDKLK